ncbi:MAG: metal ABC transporter substrate-binding protein [Armatimonadota bacterium]|nr:metal ABC transporter substrate-binding protein [bacterium]
MKINKLLTSTLIAAIALGAISCASAAIDIITATPELADIARQVGGNKVSVYSVAKPNRDYHRVEPRPSDVSKIAHADLVVRVGLDLDMWMDSLINASANRKVNKGGKGYVDASENIHRLEVPKEQVTGASGDIHVYGNPHYFYDPENGKVIAKNIVNGLIRIDPANKETFQDNYQAFAKEIDSRIKKWKKELEPFKGYRVVTYHQSAIYFLHRFGLKSFGTIEDKPGIPPSASHVSELIRRMKDQKIKAVVIESVYSKRFPDLIERETGTKYKTVPYSVGSDGAKSYFDLIDSWVDKYQNALR